MPSPNVPQNQICPPIAETQKLAHFASSPYGIYHSFEETLMGIDTERRHEANLPDRSTIRDMVRCSSKQKRIEIPMDIQPRISRTKSQKDHAAAHRAARQPKASAKLSCTFRGASPTALGAFPGYFSLERRTRIPIRIAWGREQMQPPCACVQRDASFLTRARSSRFSGTCTSSARSFADNRPVSSGIKVNVENRIHSPKKTVCPFQYHPLLSP